MRSQLLSYLPANLLLWRFLILSLLLILDSGVPASILPLDSRKTFWIRWILQVQPKVETYFSPSTQNYLKMALWAQILGISSGSLVLESGPAWDLGLPHDNRQVSSHDFHHAACAFPVALFSESHPSLCLSVCLGLCKGSSIETGTQWVHLLGFLYLGCWPLSKHV